MPRRRESLTGIAALFAAIPVFAQTSGGDQLDAPTLEEVIVTATRRETNLQDTAISVGVLRGQEIADAGLRDVLDYGRQVPSLVVSDQGFAGTRITIRGLGDEPNGITESLSAVYLDDTPVNQAEGLFTLNPNFELVDIDRIEVLRGPQGTLFGANAMGGAVRLLTTQPDRAAAYGTIRSHLASTAHGGDNYSADITWNTPMGDTAAARVAAYHRNDGGWIDSIGGVVRDDVNEQEVSGARLAVSWNATKDFELTGKIVYQDRGVDGFNLVDPDGRAELGIFTDSDYQVVQFSEQFRDEKAVLASVTLEGLAGWGHWTSITSWLDFDVGSQNDLHEESRYFFPFQEYLPIYGTTDYTQETFAQEIRAASASEGRLQWLAGIFYLDENIPRRDTIRWDDNGLGPDELFLDDIKNTRTDLAVFGELSWALTDDVQGTLGARWYDLEKEFTSVSRLLFDGYVPVSVKTRHKEDGVTPKLGLSWDIDDRVMLYGLATQGFRAGGANTALAVNECGAPGSYESDDLWNYEIGLKTRGLEDRMQLNISLYTIDWSDVQVEVQPDGCFNVYIVNAGEAESDGIEFEWTWLVNDAWTLRLVSAWNDAKIKSAPPGSFISDGTPLPLIPDWTASANTTNNFSVGRLNGFFRADWQYTGGTSTSLLPFDNVDQAGYHLLNLRLGVGRGTWTATLFADNVLDEQASILCCRPDGGFTTNRPRTIGLQVSYDY